MMINRPWEKTLQNQQIQNIAHLHQLGLYQHYCPPIEYQKAASPCPWPTAGMANKITQNPATHPESFRSLQAGEKRKISDIDRKKGTNGRNPNASSPHRKKATR